MRCLAVAALLSGCALLYGDSIITNGSFEDTTNIIPSWSQQDNNGLSDYVFDSNCSPTVLCLNGQYAAAGSPVLPGWTVSGSVDMGMAGFQGFWTASDGFYALNLNGTSPDGTSGISQVLTGLVPGTTYQLSFDLSANTGSCYTGHLCHLNTTVDGITWNYYVSGMYEQPMVFTTETILFTALTRETTLYFENETRVSGLTGGPVIDNVQVTAQGSQPPVPEPASAPLLMLGLALLGVLLKRRRQEGSLLPSLSSSFFISSACSSSLARICSMAMRVVGSSLPR